MSRRVAVIGGGISGLTTAFVLERRGIDVTLFEASERVGGNIDTIEKDGYIIEQGPSSLLRSPRMVQLIRLAGLESKLLPANAAARKRYILWNGKLHEIGPKAFLNGLFSPRTLLSLAGEPLVRSRSHENESVAEFVRRRIGGEFLEKAIDPFVSGVYAGDPEDLSMRSAFPKLFEMERDFGSLIMGAIRRSSPKPDPTFPRTFSFSGGLRTLTDALSFELDGRVRLSEAVVEIGRADGVYLVSGESFHSVVISTPAYVAANLIGRMDAELAGMLRDVIYPSIAVVALGFRTEQIGTALDGFGFLIPSKEKRPILGTLFHSAVFPERAPAGHQLLMTFVGGVRDTAAVADKTDDELSTLVIEQLRQILAVAGEPSLCHIKRWPRAIPQYRVGYERVTEACERFQRMHRGLYFCSNFFRGVSIGDCVKNAFATADNIKEYLGQ